MRSWPIAVVALAVVTACTGPPATPSQVTPRASEPLPRTAIVLPAYHAPGPPYWGGLTAAVSDDPDVCDSLPNVSCVPSGVYQQQAADGDWCSWTYYPAEYFRQADQDDGSVAYLDLVVRDWKDADGQVVALFDGDHLGYGPTTGARQFSQGFPASEGWEGDGKARGCAEWDRVGTLDEAVPVSTPTPQECGHLIRTGEAASDHVDEVVAARLAEMSELALVVHEALGAGPAFEPTPATLDRLWIALTEVGAVVKDAYPALKRATDCHRFMGNDDEASAMSSIASGYLYAWADLKKSCPTDFAPLGFNCTRL